MSKEKLNNINIVSRNVLPTPEEVISKFPISDQSAETVLTARKSIENILDGKDSRVFIVVGPCSIHDEKLALEYAEKLKGLADKVSDKIVLVMRTYFEKPRTTVGWKGFINDPYLNGSFNIKEGIEKARKLLVNINDIGVPVATEALDPIIPQYMDDLLTWAAIGARTVESQTHREMASGLSSPVGFKNTTGGNVNLVINAIKSSLGAHRFLGINKEGQCSVFETKGNPYTHVVLRGGKKPNYDSESVKACEELLAKAELPLSIMVDCSHGNSNKDYRNQPLVLEDCINQIVNGNKSIKSFMIESNINEGNQSSSSKDLKYGVSITDSCINWETTDRIIQEAASKL
ncbi:UNVERIFIED_CONTAM: hypothetical protein GTU68_006111 [Idotea baltica]|nr:hypothetical protein [Idotea baltica]